MCKKLNLPTSCHFNPLAEIRIGTEQEIQDIQNIVGMIVDPDGKGLNDHWAKTGAALLTGAVLHVLYCTEIKDKTLRAVASLLSNPAAGSVDEIFEDMQSYEHDPSGKFGWTTQTGEPTKTHPVIAEAAQEMLNKADNEKSGVISTAMSFLSLYRDPVVAENSRVGQIGYFCGITGIYCWLWDESLSDLPRRFPTLSSVYKRRIYYQ